MGGTIFQLFAADNPEAGAIVGLIGSLGSAAAAVTVLWMCFKYISTQEEKNRELHERLYEQLETLAKDKGQIIRDANVVMTEIKIAVKENSSITLRLQDAIQTLAQSIRIVGDAGEKIILSPTGQKIGEIHQTHETPERRLEEIRGEGA